MAVGSDSQGPPELKHSDAESGIASDVERAAAAQRPAGQDAPVVSSPRDGIPAWKWYTAMAGLYLGALLYGLDTTIAADVQASVYDTFRDIEKLPWVGLGFPMASVAVILLVGRLFGIFEIKWLTLVSITLFEVGSALCGAAPNSTALIFGRVIAGVGGAGMYLGALTFISIFVSHSQAPLYNALIGLAWGLGAILGPVIGGAFSDSSATWRWAFYINLPLAALFSPIYFFCLPSFDPRKDLSFAAKLKEVDWLGAVLNGAVFVLFMIVITFGGSTFAWNSSAAIALWVVWGVCLIAYIAQQYFAILTTPERRIFPFHFVRSRVMLLLFVATSCAAAANAVTLYYVPLFFQFTKGDSALQAAVRLLPFIIIFIFSVMLAGGTLPAVGRYNLYYLTGGILTLIGGALMFTIDNSTSTGKLYGYEILIAAGTGLVFQNAYAVAASTVKASDRSNAIGFINVSQIGSIAIALSIAGCLFQNVGFNLLRNGFAGYNFPDDYVRSALAGSISPILSSANAQIVSIAITAVVSTIQRIFAMVMAAGALLVVCAVLMPFEKLNLEMAAG